MMRFVAFFLVLLVAGSVVAPAIAQDLTQEQIDEEARRLHRHFMSPFCPGKNLADCTSSQAGVWRDQIRDWVAEGRDEKWIEARLIDEFGEQILSAPKFRSWTARSPAATSPRTTRPIRTSRPGWSRNSSSARPDQPRRWRAFLKIACHAGRPSRPVFVFWRLGW